MQHLKPPRIAPPLVMVLAAILMWALHHWLPLSYSIATPWNYLGLVPAAIGRVITVGAGRQFRRVRTTFDAFEPGNASHLVTAGVYRFSRNPMYLGSLLLLIGWAIGLGTVSPWVVLPLFAIFTSVAQIAPEERALEKRFGETYLVYRRRVRRWVGHH